MAIKFIAVPNPMPAPISDLLATRAGWGRGYIVGKFELLRIDNLDLAAEINSLGGIILPAPWRSFSNIHPKVSAEIASAIPNETFGTVGDFMSRVHGHDDWSE